jgi:hypothetical protein
VPGDEMTVDVASLSELAGVRLARKVDGGVELAVRAVHERCRSCSRISSARASARRAAHPLAYLEDVFVSLTGRQLRDG